MRTDHRGDEDDGGEENVPLHVEGFVREEILLNYLLCGVNIVMVACSIFKGENRCYLATNKEL